MSNIDFGSEYRLVGSQGSILLLNLSAVGMLDSLMRESVKALSGLGPEIGGLMIGSDASGLRLEAIYPVAIEHRFGPSYQLSHSDIELFRQTICQVRQQSELPIIGHFRGLAHGDFEVTPADRIIAGLIGGPKPLMLLIGESATEPNLARLFRRSGAEYEELVAFSFTPATSESAAITKVQGPLKPPAAGPVRLHPLTRRSRLRGVSIAALLACGALIAYFIPNAPRPVIQIAAKDLGLAVHRDGGALEVSWNRSSRAVRNGTSGVLTIVDGIQHRTIRLTPSQLRSSNAITYTPQNTAVDFRLDVYHNRDRFSDENLVVVDLPQPTPTPVMEKGKARLAPFARERLGNNVQRPLRVSASPAPKVGATLDVSKRQTPFGSAPAVPAASAAAPVLAEPLAIVFPQKPDTMPVLPPPQLDLAPQPISYVAPVAVRKVRPAVPVSLRSLVQDDISIEVKVSIDSAGKVLNATPVNTTGSGQRLLSPSAMQAAMLWRFAPARENGQPVDSQTVLKFDFARRAR